MEQIIRDLVDAAILETREWMREDVKARAQKNAEERVIDAIAGTDAREGTATCSARSSRTGYWTIP